MFVGGFLWRGEVAAWHCNNFLGFLSLLVLRMASPCHWAWSCHASGVFYIPLNPRGWFWDLWSRMRLRSSITVWVVLLSLQMGSTEGKENQRRCKHRGREGGCCDISFFSCTGAPPALQHCESWDGGSSWADAVLSAQPHPPAYSSSCQEPLHWNGCNLFQGNTVETGPELVVIWWLFKEPFIRYAFDNQRLKEKKNTGISLRKLFLWKLKETSDNGSSFYEKRLMSSNQLYQGI